MKGYYNDIIIVIALGTLIFLTLVAFITLFIVQQKRRMRFYANERRLMEAKYHQELLKAKLETQEASFRIISEELHDNIGQLLSSTRLMLSVYLKTLDAKPTNLVLADDTLAKAISDLRSLSKSLNQEWLTQFDLLKNVQSEVERLNAASGVAVSFTTTEETLPLNADAQLMLFRIVQEALQNGTKHSGAQQIRVALQRSGNVLSVSISDDGHGFLPELHNKTGVGLLSMKHRANLLGGTISWTRQMPHGTTVHISLPTQTI